VRTTFTLRRLFVVILFGGIFVLAARNITDPDFWWHLRTGQYIVETRSVPHVDSYSFTRQGHRWVAHEWLSEILIYGLYRVAGWSGLIVGFATITVVTFLFLYLRCQGQPYIAGILVLLGALASRPTWGVRPQSLSLLLASILLWLFESSVENRTRLWWIVPMTLLWANLHAGYSLGIALMILWLLGSWLDQRLASHRSLDLASYLDAMAIVLLVSGLVVMLNPNGLRLYWYPLATLNSVAMQKHIVEWFSPDFHRGEYLPFLFLLLGAVAAPFLSGLHTSPRKLLLLCVSAYGALHSSRFIPVFVLIAIPILTEHAEAWLRSRQWTRFLSGASPITAGKALVNALALVVLGTVTFLHVRTVIRYQPIAEGQTFPAAAVAFMKRNGTVSPMFNNYSWGGYLIWNLPANRVFVDGRADVYGDDLMEHFFTTYTATGDWKHDLEQWKIASVLVPTNSPLATALALDHNWQAVFRDPQAEILTNSDPAQVKPRESSSRP
jgi:hypothetical protein